MNILTSFPFTFKLTVPGLSNPFTSLATNPPSPTTSKNLPVQSKAPVREADARTRSLVRPTRPLPISISPRPSSRGARPAIPAFPPLANAATSTSLSRAHGQSHLAPLAQFQVQGPPAAPVNRKRGWEPSYSPSPSEATLASSNGYFETPARYRELGGQDSVEVQYVHGVRDLDDDDMPPAKRRRGLAGSIVSSAWSAALMGTAVGLTVYKLWRDRGKTDEDDTGFPSKMQHEIVVQDMDAMLDEPSSPPPPYNHEWGRQRDLANATSDSYLQPSLAYQQQILQQQHQAPKSRGKHRAATVTPKAQRKTAGQSTRRAAAAKSVGRSGGVVRSRPPLPSQFDFEHPPTAPAPSKRPRPVYEPSYASSTNRYPDVSSQDVSMEENEGPEGEDDDQMDWLGGKLAQLIEEGKKALGKEVVVCSDAKEDEVDDGSGAWVSDDEYNGIPGALGGERVKRRSSVKGRIGRSSTVSNGSAPYGSTATQVGLSAPTTPSRARFGVTSLPASPSSASLVKESEQFESPEVREMMEKARAKIAARLGKA